MKPFSYQKNAIVYLLCLVFFIAFQQKIFAQGQAPAPTMHCDNLQVIDKVKELIEAKKKEGFVILQGGFFNLENNTLCPIMVNLQKRHIYHIIVVGQPELRFLEVALGHEALGGDEVRDRIRQGDHTYFTYFTYVPPFDGNFLLSVTERLRKRDHFCSAIYIMLKDKALLEK
jgi:hypothetical protein